MKRLLLLIIFQIYSSTLPAQQTSEPRKYLIYLSDKANTPYSVAKPEQYLSAKSIARRQRQQIPVTTRDLPVDPAYVQTIKNTGAEVWYTSRWFNAVVIRATQAQLEQVNGLSFVRNSQNLNRVAAPAASIAVNQKNAIQTSVTASNLPEEKEAYGRAFHQANMLGATELHNAGFRGEGMTIAVLDAGFPGVNTIPA
ncbi:MAG TPA: peptidase S8, partial [Pontibacter sp.]